MSKSKFSRSISQRILDSLISEPLYKDHLKTDIDRGDVFPAIRKDRIDFYFKGGKLFSYNNVFSTHMKYASVIKTVKKSDYITEVDLKSKVQIIKNFNEEYVRIKENCSLYSGVEAIGISEIYKKFSITNIKNKSDIVVLDIEIAFTPNDDSDKSTVGTEKLHGKATKYNRIDILLFNKKTKELRFYEAKHFSNNEIWSNKGTLPAVTNQICRYEKQIKDDTVHILSEYKKYVESINQLWNCNLPLPETIDSNVYLYIFGFDANQRDGRMKELLLDDGSLTNIKHYEKGDPSSLEIRNLWGQSK